MNAINKSLVSLGYLFCSKCKTFVDNYPTIKSLFRVIRVVINNNTNTLYYSMVTVKNFLGYIKCHFCMKLYVVL